MASNPKLDAYRSLIKEGSTKDDFLARGFYAIEGQVGSGKTSLAASISPDFPVKPGETDVVLSDLAWVAIDTGALDVLKAQRIRPALEFDFADFQAAHDGNPVSAMQTIQALIKETSVGTVVFDTVSQFDVQMDAYLRLPQNRMLWSRGEPPQFDMQMFYGQIKQWHTFFHAQTRLLRKRVLYLFHTQADKADLAARTADQKTAVARDEKATGMPGSPDVVMAVTGASRDVYPRDMSLVMTVLAKPNGKGGLKRSVLTQVKDGFQAKSRYEAMLLPEEEPNLATILTKVRKASGL